MEDKLRTHSFRLPMIEMVITIGVFTVISVYIAQLFFFSNNFQRDAVNMSKALIMAESLAESLKGGISFEETLNELEFSTYNQEDTSITFIKYYDKEWSPARSNITHAINIKVTKEEEVIGIMEIAEINAYKVSGKEISNSNNHETKEWCNLLVKKYRIN